MPREFSHLCKTATVYRCIGHERMSLSVRDNTLEILQDFCDSCGALRGPSFVVRHACFLYGGKDTKGEVLLLKPSRLPLRRSIPVSS
jgi:hypothetical protein